jgi:hypothetical protein
MKFERVVLAGSVLPATYPWTQRFSGRQVSRLWNLRANRDVPVSVLCSALRGLGMRDVGTAGFSGFTDDVPERKEEVFWFDGGHSAALEPAHLPAIVDYVAGDEPDPTEVRPNARGGEQPAYRLYSRLAPWAARAILLAAFLWWALWIDGVQPWRLVAGVGAAAAAMIALDTI